MMDRLINMLFRWDKLREALFAEVHMYDQIDIALKEDMSTNLTWEEGGLWYGWHFNLMHKVYLFNDIGYESMMELWQDNWQWDSDMNMSYL